MIKGERNIAKCFCCFVSHLAMLRTYSSLCTQGSLRQAWMGKNIYDAENQTQVDCMQASALPTVLSFWLQVKHFHVAGILKELLYLKIFVEVQWLTILLVMVSCIHDPATHLLLETPFSSTKSPKTQYSLIWLSGLCIPISVNWLSSL